MGIEAAVVPRWKCRIGNDARLPLKYSGLVKEVIACPVFSQQGPNWLPKESGAIHQSSQHMRDWQIDYSGPLPLSEGSKYAFVSVDTASGLTHAFPGHSVNQTATIRGLEKLNTMYPFGIFRD